MADADRGRVVTTTKTHVYTHAYEQTGSLALNGDRGSNMSMCSADILQQFLVQFQTCHRLSFSYWLQMKKFSNNIIPLIQLFDHFAASGKRYFWYHYSVCKQDVQQKKLTISINKISLKGYCKYVGRQRGIILSIC